MIIEKKWENTDKVGHVRADHVINFCQELEVHILKLSGGPGEPGGAPLYNLSVAWVSYLWCART